MAKTYAEAMGLPMEYQRCWKCGKKIEVSPLIAQYGFPNSTLCSECRDGKQKGTDMNFGQCVHGNNLASCEKCRAPTVNPIPITMSGSMTFTLPNPLVQAQYPITGFPDVDKFLEETFEVMRKKGHDYRQGNDSDLLHNFRTVGNAVDEDMMKVWFTYFYKHYSAMVTYIKEGGQSESEPIEGRITDQIVYLVLFWKMVQEKKAAEKKKFWDNLKENPVIIKAPDQY